MDVSVCVCGVRICTAAASSRDRGKKFEPWQRVAICSEWKIIIGQSEWMKRTDVENRQKWKWFNINGGNYLVIFMCWYFKCLLATKISCRCRIYIQLIPTLCEMMLMGRRPPYISLMFIAYHSAPATRLTQFRAGFVAVRLTCAMHTCEFVCRCEQQAHIAQFICGRAKHYHIVVVAPNTRRTKNNKVIYVMSLFW